MKEFVNIIFAGVVTTQDVKNLTSIICKEEGLDLPNLSEGWTTLQESLAGIIREENEYNQLAVWTKESIINWHSTKKPGKFINIEMWPNGRILVDICMGEGDDRLSLEESQTFKGLGLTWVKGSFVLDEQGLRAALAEARAEAKAAFQKGREAGRNGY